MSRHFIDIYDISLHNLEYILDLSLKIKKNPQDYYDKLKYKKAIILLEKNSSRTRVSFEFALKELGAHCCILDANNSQLSRGESIEDTAKVFDRYADCIIFRTFQHERLLSLQKNCNKAIVINALTDYSHPCQVMADIMTIFENFNSIKNIQIAWIGDVNNMLRSWIQASEKFNFQINIYCPEIYRKNLNNGFDGKNFKFFNSKYEAVKDCNVVTTDTFVSMGEDKAKLQVFKDFIVNEELMKFAKKNAIFLHCLPAYREFEVSADIIDNPKYSKVIFDEAENRLHRQKAILMWCLCDDNL